MTEDKQLEKAIAQTLEDPNGFQYVAKLLYEVEHFEHNTRLVTDGLQGAVARVGETSDETGTDGVMYEQLWFVDTSERAFEILNVLSKMPFIGEVFMVYEKYHHGQEH